MRKLKPHIDNMLPNASWNFDLKDCDNILRIESEENVVDLMINLLNMHQFDCVELV